MRIGFHTSGGPVMGLGHVYRCLALANAVEARIPNAECGFEMTGCDDGISVVRSAGRVVDAALAEAPPDSGPNSPILSTSPVLRSPEMHDWRQVPGLPLVAGVAPTAILIGAIALFRYRRR